VRVRIAVAIAVLGVGALIPLFARANHLDLSDGNDTRGLLDVKNIVTWGSTRRPGWRIVTYRRWTTRRIWDKGFVLVFLDTFGKDNPDYYALISSYGRGMQGRLFRDRQKRRDYEIGQVAVWRKNGRSVSLRIPLRKVRIGDNRTFYRWYVQTLFTGRRCRRVCFDLVPDAQSVLEPLVEPSPTPTTSPTGSPTPTPAP
jgi:hypothetical protein